ncbi:amiloride-sensitive amine oxidase, copper-containing, putative [Eimeria maxima]|uniref:Amine oxidase n=1 Tax=Eimeria maxima TaxID=5804 RepID=U6LYV6_EIMMA|nr:amiloride-sensitive amine oxidase, copper-containing, putative [Eimeria maxima]CDJ57132.1 amiloride-sensitive amine oxidase, copper-containing, putative [Eimeria maxima]
MGGTIAVFAVRIRLQPVLLCAMLSLVSFLNYLLLASAVAAATDAAGTRAASTGAAGGVAAGKGAAGAAAEGVSPRSSAWDNNALMRPRRLAPQECKTYVYTDSEQEPAEMSDRSSCPTGGGKRAFLLDTSPEGAGSPALLEVSPVQAQQYACRASRPCSVVVPGFGLQAEESIAVLKGKQECPPSSLRSAQIITSNRHISSSAAATFNFQIRPQRTITELPVFELGPVQGDTFTLCYSPFLATRGEIPAARDYHYRAGVVSIRDEMMNCDFEEGMCGLMSFVVDPRLSLEWRRHSGATETAGTGPSFDHTYGRRQRRRGHYLYMDSPGYMLGESAALLAAAQIYPKGLYCLRLWYHMYGEDVNSLRVYMRYLEGDAETLGDWGKPYLLRVGDHGDDWLEAGFEFTSDGHTAQQLVIEALAGFGEKGDIAIDDLRIVSGKCPEQIARDVMQQEFICGEVRLTTGKYAEDKQWFVEGAVSCAGKGYSLSSMQGRWVPCCVPRYGSYTVVLRDAYGDGWDRSRLEFRFFGDHLTFGEDFDGAEKKYKLNIGLVQLQRVEGSEDRIGFQVQVAEPHMHVWCGAAQSGTPPPTVEILKRYGIRSQNPTSHAGEVLRMEIANKPNSRRVVMPNTTYNVYCYAEASTAALRDHTTAPGGRHHQIMDDAQVAASRMAVTTDSTPPQLSIQGSESHLNEVVVRVATDEPATVWCLARDAKKEAAADGEVPSVEELKKGNKVQILEGQEGTLRPLEVTGLSPDTEYTIYCLAQDTAMPKGNSISLQQVQDASFAVATKSKVPELSIASYKAFQKGFRVTVQTDTPAKVWCGAAMAGSAFPSREEVRRVGATAEIEEGGLKAELEIRGVPPNTRYTIYCFASSRGGSAEMTDAQMWAKALEVTSFGRFCDMPVEPPDLEQAEKPTLFDPLTSSEEFMVREFMARQRHLNIEGVYRINLFIDKPKIINHLDKGAPAPRRYARARVGTCVEREGAYRQYKVGPLDVRSVDQMTLEPIGVVVPTDCGGYNPQGVFGRRLLAEEEEEQLSDLLQESFGFGFGKAKCQFEHKKPHDQHNGGCLEFGPMLYEEGEDKKITTIWAGLRTPNGDNIPFYFLLPAPEGVDAQTLRQQEEREELTFKLDKVKGYWYNGQGFSTLRELVEAYKTDASFEKVTPAIFQQRLLEQQNQQQQQQQRQRRDRQAALRRLAPTWLAPNPEGRGGLEYRAAPEHIEPQGRRYTIKQSPGKESYTISYAGWEFVINMDRDTALRLWDIRFQGQRLVFEMGMMEALAHYSVAERNWYFIDSWYGGLGSASRRLHPGIECSKTGQLLFNGGSLCIFEKDFARPLRAHWKSGTLRDGAPHLALVLRHMITVSNYDYITDYYFHVSGWFEASVSFTGELYAGVEVPWYSARQRRHGTQVSGSMRMGALHGHLAVWKVDFDLTPDYTSNSVVFSEIVHDTARPGAIKLDQWIGEKELDGYIAYNSTRPIHYTVVNEDHNVYGNVGGMTIPNPKFELYTGPCAWAKYRVATTVRHPDETEATLPRDNKYALKPAVSLDRYLRNNESIRKADLVTWISSAVWHIPVVEDMPLTLAQGNTLGWLVKPHNYYMEDMSMDLHNAIGGAVQDPGTCALIRQETPKYGADSADS